MPVIIINDDGVCGLCVSVSWDSYAHTAGGHVSITTCADGHSPLPIIIINGDGGCGHVSNKACIDGQSPQLLFYETSIESE